MQKYKFAATLRSGKNVVKFSLAGETGKKTRKARLKPELPSPLPQSAPQGTLLNTVDTCYVKPSERAVTQEIEDGIDVDVFRCGRATISRQ